MARILGVLIAVVMVVGGGLATAQSNGWMQGPLDQGVWVTLGPIIAGFGVALAWVVLRPRR